MIIFFQILAVILTGIAAYFLWMENKDGVFVAIALAACSFLMSTRFQTKDRLTRSETERQAAGESDD
jgi:Flp pilus assembly protein TadB